MIQRQVELGGSWEVHYACRAAEYAAFLEDITEADGDAVGKVKLHLDSESGGQVLDIKAIVDKAPDGSIFYCCGPRRCSKPISRRQPLFRPIACASNISARQAHPPIPAPPASSPAGSPRGAATLIGR